MRWIGIAVLALLMASAGSTQPWAAWGGAGWTSGDVPPAIRAAGRGYPWINLRDGFPLPGSYRGAAELVGLLERDDAEPLTLAAADFDTDGMPDLVAGYSGPAGGILVIHRGNIEAVYPSRKVTQHSAAPPPFLSPARVLASPVAPAFLAAGDFDADGHADIVLADRLDPALYLLRGDSRGGFEGPLAIALPGSVGALRAGEMDRPDGLPDLAVGVSTPGHAAILLLEGPEGALRSTPRAFALPAPATDMALADYDGDILQDLAVAAGRHVVVLHGRYAPSLLWSHGNVPAARMIRRLLPSPVVRLAAGDFTGDQVGDLALAMADGTLRLLSSDDETSALPPSGTSAHSIRRPPIAAWQLESLGRTTLPAPAQLVTVRMASLPREQLLTVDPAGRRLEVVTRRWSGKAFQAAPASLLPNRVALDGQRPPVAALPMRLNIDGLSDLVILRRGQSEPVVVETEPVRTFVVNYQVTDPQTFRRFDASGRIICDVDEQKPGEQCTLRAALIAANESPGADLVTFDVLFPELIDFRGSIEETVTVDGGPPRADGFPNVTLDGHMSRGIAFAIQSGGGNSVIRGLHIVRFPGTAVLLEFAGGNTVEANVIGAGRDYRKGNGGSGIFVEAGSPDNVIGGTALAARNIIAGNGGSGVDIRSNGNRVEGNFIGVDIEGDRQGNESHGVQVGGEGNTIGGVTHRPGSAPGNVISGNGAARVVKECEGAGCSGVMIFGNGNLVQGNLIGTGPHGSGTLGNRTGVFILSSQNLIGGTTSLVRNVISGNQRGVVIECPPAGAPPEFNALQGNFIGTDIEGARAVGNDLGVYLNGTGLNVIGGGKPGARNVISGNAHHAVWLTGRETPVGGKHSCDARDTTANRVFGNFIGTAADGEKALPNDGAGVFIEGAPRNFIGEEASEPGRPPGNLIANNVSAGIEILGRGTFVADAAGNRVAGNLIVGNGVPRPPFRSLRPGILVQDAAANIIGGPEPGEGNSIERNAAGGIWIIGSRGAEAPATTSNRVLGNTITRNEGDGVRVMSDATGSVIRGNSIFDNPGGTTGGPGLGINLVGSGGIDANDSGDTDAGPNGLQNFPSLEVTITGDAVLVRLDGFRAGGRFTIELFANADCDRSGNGEGERRLGSTTALASRDGPTRFIFRFPGTVEEGDFITATATGREGTSEFSPCAQVPVVGGRQRPEGGR